MAGIELVRSGKESPVKVCARFLASLFFLLAVSLLVSAVSFARTDSGNEDLAQLTIAAMEFPPFAMKSADGEWRGLSFDLLDRISAQLGRDYHVREYTDITALLAAISAGEVDLTPVLAAREEVETVLDLSQPYYRSGFAIAASADDVGRGWLGFFRALEVRQFFTVVGGLTLLWFLAGACIWLLERRRNGRMFGGGPVKGLGQGIWWAAVTMTTVGYGDKAPVTPGGRMIAIIWMFASIVLVSTFTASISASLTAEKLIGKVRGVQDLPRVRVGTMGKSSAVDWLRGRGVSALEFATPRQGLQAVADGTVDAFVFDDAVLRNIAATEFPGQVYVLPESFEHYFVSMGLQNRSQLTESINRAILRTMATDDWNGLLEYHVARGR